MTFSSSTLRLYTQLEPRCSIKGRFTPTTVMQCSWNPKFSLPHFGQLHEGNSSCSLACNNNTQQLKDATQPKPSYSSGNQPKLTRRYSWCRSYLSRCSLYRRSVVPELFANAVKPITVM